MADSGSLVLGKLAIKHKFAQPDQIKQALLLQQKEKNEGKNNLFGSILVRMGLIDQKQLDFLLSIQMMMQQRKLDRQFGALAVKNDFIQEEDVERALDEQEKIFKEHQSVRLIGEILVKWGKLEPGQRDDILERQQRLAKFSAAPPEEPAKEKPIDEKPAPAEDREQAEKESSQNDKVNDVLDNLFSINISPDGMNASITPVRPIPDSITVEALKVFLQENYVAHGLLEDEALEEFLRERARSGHPFEIAQGTPPQPGKDASIQYHFDTDPLRVGTIKEGGNIDFKDKGEIPQVKEGTLLAERIPPEEGTPGTSVSDKPIPPPKPQNVKLRKGKGAKISSDGLQLFAEAGGRPELSADGKVYVFSEHKINGDVDLKTGHVDFEGGIQVNGSIKRGFRVRGGSLAANEIIGAEIDIKGDIAVTGGIIGANIRLGGNLRARYIHKTRIETYGDVVVDKEVIDADIEGSGAFIVKSGPVLSSKIIAKKGIEVLQVGSKTSNPCNLIAGTEDRVNNEISKIQQQIEELVKVKEDLEKQIEVLEHKKLDISIKLGEEAQYQDKSSVKKRQLEEKMPLILKEGNEEKKKKIGQILSALNKEIKDREVVLEGFFAKEDEINSKIEDYNKRIEEIDSQVEEIKGEIDHLKEWAAGEEAIPVLKVHGKLFPFADVRGPHTFLTVPKGHERVQIKEIKLESEDADKQWVLKISPLK